MERMNALHSDMQAMHATTQEKVSEELKRIQDVTNVAKQPENLKLRIAQAKFYRGRADKLADENALLKQSIPLEPKVVVETDSVKCLKLTERICVLETQIEKLKKDYDAVRTENDTYVEILTSIPMDSQPKRERALGSPSATPDGKRHKPSDTDGIIDLAESKAEEIPSEKEKPLDPPAKRWWGDGGDQDPEEEGSVAEIAKEGSSTTLQGSSTTTVKQNSNVGKVPKEHSDLFLKGAPLYTEFCARAVLPKASALTLGEMNAYKVGDFVPPHCPDWLVNTQRMLTGEQLNEVQNSGTINALRHNHDRICRKYRTQSLIGETAAEQAAINLELRDAVHSHAETWEWRKGGIGLHLRKMKAQDLSRMVTILHTAAMKVSEQNYRETSDNKELLDLTWNCSADRGKTFARVDACVAHGPMRHFMNIPQNCAVSTIPTLFYYTVWEEYAAAELYRRELESKSNGNAAQLDEYFEGMESDDSDSGSRFDDDALYDSCITHRDSDLLLAINLEKSTITEGNGKPKQSELQKYQTPRKFIVNAWLKHVDFRDADRLEQAIKYRAPKNIWNTFVLLLKQDKLCLKDLGEERARNYLGTSYNEYILDLAKKEKKRMRDILVHTAIARYNRQIPSSWNLPVPIPKEPVLHQRAPSPPPNAWNQPNMIQQIHGHNQQHHLHTPQQQMQAVYHNHQNHQNHRDDFNNNPYPQFAPYGYNPYPPQHQQPAPPGWGNYVRTNPNKNSYGPAGQGKK